MHTLSIEVQAYGFVFPEVDLAALTRIQAKAFPAFRMDLFARLARATEVGERPARCSESSPMRRPEVEV